MTATTSAYDDDRDDAFDLYPADDPGTPPAAADRLEPTPDPPDDPAALAGPPKRRATKPAGARRKRRKIAHFHPETIPVGNCPDSLADPPRLSSAAIMAVKKLVRAHRSKGLIVPLPARTIGDLAQAPERFARLAILYLGESDEALLEPAAHAIVKSRAASRQLAYALGQRRPAGLPFADDLPAAVDVALPILIWSRGRVFIKR